MIKYSGDAISEQEWGVMDDEAIGSHDFVRTKVTRSNRLSCRTCKKPLPMGARAVFELDGGRFVTVYCPKCANEDETIFIAENSQRHPMDLEDRMLDLTYAQRAYDRMEQPEYDEPWCGVGYRAGSLRFSSPRLDGATVIPDLGTCPYCRNPLAWDRVNDALAWCETVPKCGYDNGISEEANRLLVITGVMPKGE